MKKPDSISFSRPNKTLPFEDQSSVEFLCQRNDCSLFAFGSHSKKRPHNLILGRCYDFQVLHMVIIQRTNLFKRCYKVVGASTGSGVVSLLFEARGWSPTGQRFLPGKWTPPPSNLQISKIAQLQNLTEVASSYRWCVDAIVLIVPMIVLMIALMCWWLCWYDVLRCWRVGDIVLMTVLFDDCWCVDVLMCW
jgi:hypothetical protein